MVHSVDKEADSITIRDFGEQWSHYRTNEGFYGSTDLFLDAFPSVDPNRLVGSRVLDIGSGTGRIVLMLLELGVSHVTAVEPSESFEVLAANLQPYSDRVTLLKIPGEALAIENEFDFVFSYGVIHHIPDPFPAVRAAVRALKSDGKIYLWVYGREGNRLFLAVILPLRKLTTKLPHPILVAITFLLDVLLWVYIRACHVIPLPLHRYATKVLVKLSAESRRLVIYDQLNPRYAKYYTRSEAIALLEACGLTEVRADHRHGYSWSVSGTKREPTLDSFSR